MFEAYQIQVVAWAKGGCIPLLVGVEKIKGFGAPFQLQLTKS